MINLDLFSGCYKILLGVNYTGKYIFLYTKEEEG